MREIYCMWWTSFTGASTDIFSTLSLLDAPCSEPRDEALQHEPADSRVGRVNTSMGLLDGAEMGKLQTRNDRPHCKSREEKT